MPATNPDDDTKMFDLAPVSLWIEDFSAVKALFEQWRAEGVADLKTFLAGNPEWTKEDAALYVSGPLVEEGGSMRILPHRHGTDGAYAVRLKRQAE